MKFEVTGRHLEVDKKMLSYVEDKLDDLDKYIPRAIRPAAHALVTLELDLSGREDNQYVAEVILTVPGGPIVSKEATLNIYAAIDIVEAKLRSQLETYKAKHSTPTRRERIKARLTHEGMDVVEDDEPAAE